MYIDYLGPFTFEISSLMFFLFNYPFSQFAEILYKFWIIDSNCGKFTPLCDLYFYYLQNANQNNEAV